VSTTIYDGFRLRPGTDPFDFADAVREHATRRSAHIVANEMLTRAITIADTRLVGLPADPELCPAAAASIELLDDRHTARARGNLSTGELRVWIGRDPRTRFFYGVPQVCDAQMLEEVRQVDAGWQNFEYWNNADQPDGVPDGEWQERKETWHRVLPGLGAPIDSMVSLEVRASWPTIDWDDLERSLELFADAALVCGWDVPTQENRACDLARSLVTPILCRGAGSIDEVVWRTNAAAWHTDVLADTASLIKPVLPAVSKAYLTNPVERVQIDGLDQAVQAAAQELKETL
jgi:hypothetical protein